MASSTKGLVVLVIFGLLVAWQPCVQTWLTIPIVPMSPRDGMMPTSSAITSNLPRRRHVHANVTIEVIGTNGATEFHRGFLAAIPRKSAIHRASVFGLPHPFQAGVRNRFVTQSHAKTDATEAFGKLVAAIVKCFGSVSGVDMNKFKHVWTAAHGLDKLNPADMVWEIVKVVNPGAKGLGAIYIVLKSTQTIIKITTAVTPAGAGAMGTAYVVSEIADGLIKNC